MPKKEVEVPVYMSVSDILSVETLLRKQINSLDEKIRSNRSMFEQREALRDRIRHFDHINTKMFLARDGDHLLTAEQKLLLEWMLQDKESEAILVISNLYEFGSKKWFRRLEKNGDLQEAYDSLHADPALLSNLIQIYIHQVESRVNLEKSKVKAKGKKKKSKKMQEVMAVYSGN